MLNPVSCYVHFVKFKLVGNSRISRFNELFFIISSANAKKKMSKLNDVSRIIKEMRL